jgi:hypothetical protein
MQDEKDDGQTNNSILPTGPQAPQALALIHTFTRFYTDAAY